MHGCPRQGALSVGAACALDGDGDGCVPPAHDRDICMARDRERLRPVLHAASNSIKRRSPSRSSACLVLCSSCQPRNMCERSLWHWPSCDLILVDPVLYGQDATTKSTISGIHILLGLGPNYGIMIVKSSNCRDREREREREKSLKEIGRNAGFACVCSQLRPFLAHDRLSLLTGFQRRHTPHSQKGGKRKASVTVYGCAR